MSILYFIQITLILMYVFISFHATMINFGLVRALYYFNRPFWHFCVRWQRLLYVLLSLFLSLFDIQRLLLFLPKFFLSTFSFVIMCVHVPIKHWLHFSYIHAILIVSQSLTLIPVSLSFIRTFLRNPVV